MSRFLRIPMLLLVTLACTSCVRFDGQTLSFSYDKKSDTLRIFQLYERIDADGDEGKLTQTERQQISSLFKDETTFCFDNWILVYSRKQTQESIANIEMELKQKDVKNPDGLRAQRNLHQIMLETIHVENGEFFLNDQQELCGYQVVTIEHASKLVDAANHWLSLWAGKSDVGQLSPAAERRLDEFRKQGDWIELSSNRLVVKFLMSRKDFESGKQDREKYTADGKPALAGKINYAEPIVEFTFGKPNDPRTDFHIDNIQSGESNNLVRDYVKRQYSVKEYLDIDKLRDHFLKTGKLR